MESIALDIYESAAVGAVVLALGMLVVSRSPALRRYCIPAPVVGGLVFMLASCALHEAGVLEIEFDDTLQKVFMTAFFCSVGFMASFELLRRGGRDLVLLLAVAGGLVIAQDLLGCGLASVLGLDSRLGLAMGSIGLVGGHGTAGSFGPLMEDDFGVANAEAVAIATATLGLAVAGFVGGPLARRRVEAGNLRPDEDDVETEEEIENSEEGTTEHGFLIALMLLAIAIGIGVVIDEALDATGITVPTYLGAMVAALVFRNVADKTQRKLPMREISTLGAICLQMFLAMVLMGTQLWTLEEIAGSMAVVLGLQLVVTSLFCYFVAFRAMGGGYDGAVAVTALAGFGLGATPNAVANMNSLFDRYGRSPRMALVVPLVGSVFLDIVNMAVILTMLNILRWLPLNTAVGSDVAWTLVWRRGSFSLPRAAP